MKLETLSNSFHGTSIQIRGGRDEWGRLQMVKCCGTATPADKAKLARIRRTLCGFADCTCGTVR